MSNEVPEIHRDMNIPRTRKIEDQTTGNIVAEKMREEKILFQDKVGNHLMAAHWALKAGMPDGVEKAKESFYSALEDFFSGSAGSSDIINGQVLAELKKYKDTDWKDKNNLQKVMDYFKEVAY